MEIGMRVGVGDGVLIGVGYGDDDDVVVVVVWEGRRLRERKNGP